MVLGLKISCGKMTNDMIKEQHYKFLQAFVLGNPRNRGGRIGLGEGRIFIGHFMMPTKVATLT